MAVKKNRESGGKLESVRNELLYDKDKKPLTIQVSIQIMFPSTHLKFIKCTEQYNIYPNNLGLARIKIFKIRAIRKCHQPEESTKEPSSGFNRRKIN